MSDARNEYIAGKLTDRDDEAEHREAYEATRNVDLGHERGWVSTQEMVALNAAARAAIESQSHKDHIREVAEKALVYQAWHELQQEGDAA